MSAPAQLLTVVIETDGDPDRESTTYRRLLSARLRYEDDFTIRFTDGPLSLPAIAELTAQLSSTYVVFIRLAHQVSANYLPTLLDYLKGRTVYVAEPVVYTGALPAQPATTKINDDYFYARDTGPYGIVYNTRRLSDVLEAIGDVDAEALYLAYRLYWSIAKVKPLPVGYSVASDTKAAIGVRLSPQARRLVPLIPTRSPEMRLYLLRLLAVFLRGLRGSKQTSVSLAHIRDLIHEFDLESEVARVRALQPFEASWISWLADHANDSHLYKQLTGQDAYLIFRKGDIEIPSDEVPLYRIEFSDAVTSIAKAYLDKNLRPDYERPGTYDFYRRSITPSSTLLFFDRPMQADDNAEHLYEYFQSHHPEFTNLSFALSRKSPDWDRLAAKGFNLVPIFTTEFYETFLRSDAVISSQIYNIRYRGKSLANSRFVYLQHGVQLNDMTDWVISKYFDVFVATGKLEADYLGAVAPVETLNSGLPRMESLRRTSGERDTLVFMPTWRFNLHQSSNEHFKQSEYFRAIDELLTDPALLSFLERTDRELQVKLHPNVEKRAASFRFSERVTRCEASYRDALASAEMIFTDYSSVVLDAAFIGTPVAYYQWDADSFFLEQPYEGRLDYQTEGLGPVYFSKDELVNHIVTEEYKTSQERFTDRRERFFEGVDPKRINATIVERILSL